MILPYRRHGVRALVEAACAEAGFQLRVAVSSPDLGDQAAGAARPRDVVLPTAVVANEVRLGQLHAVTIDVRSCCGRSDWHGAVTSTRRQLLARWNRRSCRWRRRLRLALMGITELVRDRRQPQPVWFATLAGGECLEIALHLDPEARRDGLELRSEARFAVTLIYLNGEIVDERDA